MINKRRRKRRKGKKKKGKKEGRQREGNTGENYKLLLKVIKIKYYKRLCLFDS